MKAKLTITVERTLVPRAKASTRRQGRSLSSLVEKALEEASQPEAPDFAARWCGKFKPAQRPTARYRKLAEKYL